MLRGNRPQDTHWAWWRPLDSSNLASCTLYWSTQERPRHHLRGNVSQWLIGTHLISRHQISFCAVHSFALSATILGWCSGPYRSTSSHFRDVCSGWCDEQSKEWKFVASFGAGNGFWINPNGFVQKRNKWFWSVWMFHFLSYQWIWDFLRLGSTKACKWRGKDSDATFTKQRKPQNTKNHFVI